MRPDKINQIVFCSETPGRAFLREITFTRRAAMVTNVEKLPPGYECAIDRMRDVNERVLQFNTSTTCKPGCDKCPFCGNGTIFICDCGAISCMATDKDHHTCPVHGGIYNTADTDEFEASDSGLPPGGLSRLHAARLGPDIYQAVPPAPPLVQYLDDGKWETRSAAERQRDAESRSKLGSFLNTTNEAQRRLTAGPDLKALIQPTPKFLPPAPNRTLPVSLPSLPSAPPPLLLPPSTGSTALSVMDIWNTSAKRDTPGVSPPANAGASTDAKERLRQFFQKKGSSGPI